MLSGKPSQTLLIASIMRARHQLLDTPVILKTPQSSISRGARS